MKKSSSIVTTNIENSATSTQSVALKTQQVNSQNCLLLGGFFVCVYFIFNIETEPFTSRFMTQFQELRSNRSAHFSIRSEQ